MKLKPVKTITAFSFAFAILCILHACRVEDPGEAIKRYTGTTTDTTTDTTAPTVMSMSPADGTSDVCPDGLNSVRVVFSEEMDRASITTTSFVVNDGSNDMIGTTTYGNKTATFTPSSSFLFNKTYSVKITTGVRDTAGNSLPDMFSGSFSTDFKSTGSSFAVLKNKTKIVTLATNQDGRTSITFTVITNPDHGGISLSGSSATYTPATDYVGSDSFVFKGEAGTYGESTQGTVAIIVSSSLLSDTNQTASYTTTFGEDSDYTINAPSYTDNGNGTVTDNITGLIWQKSDDNTERTWTNAKTYCDTLTLGGKSDWRLPAVRELVSILDLGTHGPAINSIFTGTDSSDYWSSTTNARDTGDAWNVYFGNGRVGGDHKSGTYDVRCVRAGQ